jgi:hypothetical protein
VSDWNEIVEALVAAAGGRTRDGNVYDISIEDALDTLRALFAEKPRLANALLPEGWVAVKAEDVVPRKLMFSPAATLTDQ